MKKEVIKINNGDNKIDSGFLDLCIKNLSDKYNLSMKPYHIKYPYKKYKDDEEVEVYTEEELDTMSKNRTIKAINVIFESIARYLIYSYNDELAPVVFEIGTNDKLIAFAQLSKEDNILKYNIHFDSDNLPGARYIVGNCIEYYDLFYIVGMYRYMMGFESVETTYLLTNCIFETIQEYLLNSDCNEIEFEDTFRATLTKDNKCVIKPIGYNKFIIDEFIFNSSHYAMINRIKKLQ